MCPARYGAVPRQRDPTQIQPTPIPPKFKVHHLVSAGLPNATECAHGEPVPRSPPPAVSHKTTVEACIPALCSAGSSS
jgi:hypothetical protein